MLRKQIRVLSVLSYVLIVSSLAGLAADPPAGCLDPVGDWGYGPVYAAAAGGDYAYAGSGTMFLVLDVSDPSQAVPLGDLSLPGVIQDIELHRGYAYVAVTYAGLAVVDLGDPQQPLLAGWLDTIGDAYGVALTDGYAYVAGLRGGVQIVDIHNPEEPWRVGSHWVYGEATDLATAGPLLYVTVGPSGMMIFSIAAPNSLEYLGSFATQAYAHDVAVRGSHAFVVDGWGVYAVDATNPNLPSELDRFQTSGLAFGIKVAGDHAFVVDQWNGLRVLDISDSTNLTQIGWVDTPGGASDLAVDSSRVFVADEFAGLRVIDVQSPVAPVETAFHDTPGTAHGVASFGDDVFIVDLHGGMRVVDVSDPATPTQIGQCPVNSPENVFYWRDMAFATEGWQGLRILDVRDPRTPIDLGRYDSPGMVRGVAVAGDVAYIADGPGGLRVVDVSDPGAPVEIGFLPTGGNDARNVDVWGDHAFVIDNGAMVAVDISVPSAAFEAGRSSTPQHPWDIDVTGGYAYVTDTTAGSLRVFDVHNPASPSEIATLNVQGAPRGIAIAGNYAYVAMEWWSYLLVIDIHDPYNPVEIGRRAIPSSNWDVTIANDTVHLAARAAGLRSYSVCGPVCGPVTFDLDCDTVEDLFDNCADAANLFQSDLDADLVGDICDPCPAVVGSDCDPGGSVAREIDQAAGGTVSTPDGSLTLSIEPGALEQDATVAVTNVEFNDPDVDLVLATGAGLGKRVAVYDLQPDGQEFAAPVQLTMVVDTCDPRPCLNRNQLDHLTLYMEDASGALLPIPGSSCDVVGTIATCTATIEHFSRYVAAAPRDTDDDGIFDLFGGIEDICLLETNVLVGLLPPMTDLVADGMKPPLPSRAFKAGRTVPLKLDYSCDETAVTDQSGVRSPEILFVRRVSDAKSLPLEETVASTLGDNGAPWFRYSGEHWIHNLGTRDMSPGTYEIGIRLSDGRPFVAAMVLR